MRDYGQSIPQKLLRMFSQKNISIQVTGEELKVCEIEKKGSSLSVLRAFTLPTPPDCVDDGLILDAAHLAALISGALVERRIAKTKLFFTISSRKIAAKEIELPYMKNTALIGEMINANLDEYFPMGHLEEYITRFSVLDTTAPGTDAGERRMSRIVVYAVQKEIVASYIELAKALKMPLASIDYSVNSLYCLVQKQNKQGTALILQIDSDASHISIMRGSSQLFRRSVPYGSDTIVQAMAAAKGMDEEEAARILTDADAPEAALDADEYRDLIQDFAASIMRVVDFFISKNPEVAIEEGKIFGAGAHITRIDEMLGQALGLPMRRLEQLAGVNIRKTKSSDTLADASDAPSTYADLADYLPNIGALLNPLDLRLQEEVVLTKTGIGIGFLAAMAVVAALAAGGTFTFFHWQGTLLAQERAALARINDSLRSAELVHDTYLYSAEYLREVAAFDAGTRNANEALLTLIRSLEEIMPEGVAISQFAASDGNISMSVTSANGKEEVALLIIELKKLPFVSDIWVSNVSDSHGESGAVMSRFPLSFTIRDIADGDEEGGE